jgi:transposase
MNKKEVAKTLFLNGKTLKEIAKLIDVNYDTVKQWSSRNNWKTFQVTNTKSDSDKGRKSKYYINVKPKFKYIEKLIREGIKLKDIAKRLNIDESTFYDYKNKHSEFSKLIKNARINYASEIEENFLKKAYGQMFDWDETINYDKDGNIVDDKKTGVARQKKKNSSNNFLRELSILKQYFPEIYNKELMQRKAEFEHKKKNDEEKLKLLKENENNGNININIKRYYDDE